MILTQDFEDSEAKEPFDSITKAGHRTDIIGPQAGTYLKGKKGDTTLKTDLPISEANAHNCDLLVSPGGHSPESLRAVAGAVEFVQEFGATGRPIAAVCHGPQLLILKVCKPSPLRFESGTQYRERAGRRG